MKSIGIIGFGTMGEAIARGLRSGSRGDTGAADVSIAIVEKSAARRKAASELPGVVDFSDRDTELAEFADLIVLAIKPQDLDDLADRFGHILSGNRVISILAGISIGTLNRYFPGCQVIRFMPNLAASIGRAAVGIAIPEDTAPEFREDAFLVARAIGRPFELEERLLAAFTGISGSGIAYVFAFLNALALGGTRAGIPFEKSLEIAMSVMQGAVELSRSQDVPPATLIGKVVSPAGTTIEGIHALEEAGFTAAVMDAVVRAAKRADTLEA